MRMYPRFAIVLNPITIYSKFTGSIMASGNGITKDVALAGLYFFLSTVITWWFIDRGAVLYHFDMQKMLLSCSVAGGKWAIQIGAALLWLHEQRWPFIRRIAFTCFAGSCILLPFCFGLPTVIMGINSFLLSLILAVACMLVLYYRSVRSTGLHIKWFLGWVVCLCIAVSLQLTVVFHVIGK